LELFSFVKQIFSSLVFLKFVVEKEKD